MPNTQHRHPIPYTLYPVPFLLLFALAGCGHQSKAAADAGGDSADAASQSVVSVLTITVAPQTIRSSLDVTGTLGPLPGLEAKVAPAAPGRVKQVLVQNGQAVARGQLMAVLDQGPMVGQVRQAEAAVRQSEATVQQARANYRSTVGANLAGVQAARTNVQSAEVALQKLLAGSRPEEIASAQNMVAANQAAAAGAQQNLERQRRLFEVGLVPRKDVETAQLQVITAQATLRSAEGDLRLKLRPNRPQDIAAANLAVQQAQDALNTAIANAGQNRVKAGDVAIAEHQLQASEGALQAARAQLSAQYVRSPLAGTVVLRSANPGEYVDSTGSIATVANLSQVKVLLQVPSSQVSAVHEGDLVEFKPDSQPDHIYQARVSLVSKAVTAASETVSVEATAPNPTGQLRDDGFAHASIFTSVHQDVLAVPAASVVTLDNKPTVFVVGSDHVAHAHPVVEGLRQGDSIEIRSGVAAGDQVVTTGAYELDDGVHVKLPGEDSAGKDEGDSKDTSEGKDKAGSKDASSSKDAGDNKDAASSKSSAK